MSWWNVYRTNVNMAFKDINPDIDTERKGCNFDVEKLTHVLDGGADNTHIRRKVEGVLKQDLLTNLEELYFMNREERYLRTIRNVVYIKKKMEEMNWAEDGPESEYVFRAVKGEFGFPLHNGVFIPCINALGTDAQIAKWIPLSKSYQIIGSYAQTEMGHGTYLRGLETTAVYDASTQEFVINMPTVSAMKWWPGDMGRSATHAVVFAQLYTQGKCHGMHPFIVQIRSLEDHSPLPGVMVGDIGPKMAFEQVDNGYLMLSDVRIPKENMLSRYSKVSDDGMYRKRGSERMNYFTMVMVRVNVVATEVIPSLLKACTIAIRYSVIRRQSELKPGEKEAKILDYQTQQKKLLPQLATGYAAHFLSVGLKTFANQVYMQIKTKGDFSSLPELHALTTGLKAFITDSCIAGVEECRKACGGHGYSVLSGLPSLSTRTSASCTYEGENTVMFLQTARFLFKCLAAAQSGQSLPPSVAYLSESDIKSRTVSKKNVLNPDTYVETYRHRACRLIKEAASMLQSQIQSGVEQYVAWNNSSVKLVQAAEGHCYYITVKTFVEALEQLRHEPEIHRIVKQLCDLYALHGILSHTGDFLYDGFVTKEQMDQINQSYLELLALLRKEAVPLVDAFDYADEQLASAIGCYDGQAYSRLLEWAKKSPDNPKVKETFKQYLNSLFVSPVSKL
ncbi:peroxisomal acyl-coenzyme A oxidase 2 [Protopterus annectens]|uniref:peroxisomal acyl-coenzyme A oxidase 2 n=1 Tax=Protopterus annectens TaxID=7888 RepID=UPI001CFB9CA1|nr:peroxisomal acyl-coenzyme A oxidase 2 [Protopterus annectens]